MIPRIRSSLPSEQIQMNRGGQGATYVQEWVKKQALADILAVK